MTRSHARLWNIRLTPAKFMLATSLSILFLGFFKDAASGQPESPKSETADAMIRMDGFFDDWRGEAVILDDTGDAPDAELDIGTLQMRSDTSFIHFLVGLNRELNVQRLDGTLECLLDGDGDLSSGSTHHGMPGVDLIIRFSPVNPDRPEADNMGASVTSTSYRPADPSAAIHHSDIGFLTAPTYASDRIECRLTRNSTLPQTPPLFQGTSISMKLVLLDKERHLADETEVVSHQLPTAATSSSPNEWAAGLPQKTDAAFRVMTWNVFNDAILTKPDLYAKVLTALDPDIMLLEELGEDSAPALQSFMSERVSGDADATWQVLFGKGGGPFRCAIVSRFPMEPVPSMDWIPYPNRDDRSVRTAAGAITVGDRRVLVASVHLKCCGRIDSWEDERRTEEVSLLNQATADAKDSGGYDAVIIGGDLNLVGGRRPIGILGKELDFDGSDLTILNAYHLNGWENFTWASLRESFVPGRLDYLQYSDSTISAAKAFVFDSTDFADTWLTDHALPRNASMKASDHLPVVGDFVWAADQIQN